jgi:putative aldouronate transport system permease protein
MELNSRKLKRFKREIPLYVMLVPGILYFLIYRYLPMYGVVMAFQKFRLAKGIFGSQWIGVENFTNFFTSQFFPMVMGNTIIISMLKLLLGFPAPIILALMLNEVRTISYKRVVQTIVYLPHFISWVILGNLINIFLAPGTGLIPLLAQQNFGIAVNWMIQDIPFRVLLIVSDIWKGVGWGSIIYIAALTGVDPNLYEASIIDGANKAKQIWYITLPAIIPVIITMFILRVGGILDAGFEQILILQNDMVYRTSEIIDTYAYFRGFVNGDYGFGSAVGLFKSVVGLLMVLFVNYLSKKAGEGRLW